jgi:hypothetical protein
VSGFDGNGNFILPYNWQTDKANGIKIRADRMDGQDQAIADGLTDCVTRDGQSPATANLPMGGFKHTGVAAASARTDYARASQLQDNDLIYFTTAGTIDAYTLTPAPAITPPYTGGLSFLIKIHATSTSATPTLSVSGGSVAVICNGDLSALSPGDLGVGSQWRVSWESSVGKWLLPNRSAATFTDTSTTAATGTVAWGSGPSNRQFVYPPTAGMDLFAPSTTHGKFVLLVKQGPYELRLNGTINGAVGTISILQQQTLPLTYSTVDGVV